MIENDEETKNSAGSASWRRKTARTLAPPWELSWGWASTLLEDETLFPRRRALLLLCKHTEEALTKREITKSLKEYPAALTVKELAEILRVSTKNRV